MPDTITAVIHGKQCTFHSFTGKVVQSLKQKETVITGAADLGQTGANIVTATTRDHHELCLVNDHGQERGFKTVNLDLPCREGHIASVVWVTVGDGAGATIAVFNHTTADRVLIEPSRISFLFEKSMMAKVGIGAVIFLSATVVLDLWWGVVLALVAAVYGNWRALKAARTLLSSDALRELGIEVGRRSTAVG
jgi:hypothetical protein